MKKRAEEKIERMKEMVYKSLEISVKGWREGSQVKEEEKLNLS